MPCRKERSHADDIAAVEAELGEGILTRKTLTVEKTHEQEGTTWYVPLTDPKVVEILVKRFSFTKEEKAPFTAAKTTAAVAT